MIRSHFFLLCLVLSCYNNFNLAKIIDECLNQWCQFDNAETTEIELPFQILDGDYFELKTAKELFYSVPVSFYSTEKTKWYISDYFHNDVQFSFYRPTEYFGGNRSDVDDICKSIDAQKYYCEKNNECKVMFAMDEKREISFPSFSIDKMELWKYFDKIVLGGGTGEQKS
uniref:Uncharacterized protein n=1 Tax=Panagrolaimus davidi TaxID=227884 RepID=A0A914PW85_9BILA